MTQAEAEYQRRYRAARPGGRRAWCATHREQIAAKNAERKRTEARIETYVVYVGPVVVYVGRTDHFGRRISTHLSQRVPWLDEVTDIDHRYHATYGDSLVDEALLIRLYQPKYNQQGVTS